MHVYQRDMINRLEIDQSEERNIRKINLLLPAIDPRLLLLDERTKRKSIVPPPILNVIGTPSPGSRYVSPPSALAVVEGHGGGQGGRIFAACPGHIRHPIRRCEASFERGWAV